MVKVFINIWDWLIHYASIILDTVHYVGYI